MWVKPGLLDLTYCTNIHAGESWSEVRASVEQHALPLKEHLSPKAPFGLGLRLSAQAARELRVGDALQEFKSFLDAHGLYVAIVNGFPFGNFHGEIVKTKVFAPDWQDPARLAYTLDLAWILNELLPNQMIGGISTIPLSYKPWLHEEDTSTWLSICTHLAAMVAELVHLRRVTGKLIHVDLEPEPSGLLETTDEIIAFFSGPLATLGAIALAELLEIPGAEAQQLLREHIQVCFDVCHVAVQFEDPVSSIKLLQASGIGIGRLQISSALRIPILRASTHEDLKQQLAPLVDPIYLHQVVERDVSGTLQRFPDLEDALAQHQAEFQAEWRVHFHVPLFLEGFDTLLTTQSETIRVLRLATEQNITAHLEVETYTWHVLPAQLRLDLQSSIQRELQWTLEHTLAG